MAAEVRRIEVEVGRIELEVGIMEVGSREIENGTQTGHRTGRPIVGRSETSNHRSETRQSSTIRFLRLLLHLSPIENIVGMDREERHGDSNFAICAVTLGTSLRTRCNQIIQINHCVFLYDWLNVIANFEAHTRAFYF